MQTSDDRRGANRPAGETIEFKVSTNPPVDFQLEIFRLGYYGGAGARKLSETSPCASKRDRQ